MISQTELEQFAASMRPPVMLPSVESTLASAQSRKLLPEIRGDESYISRLHRFSAELLAILADQNPTFRRAIRRNLHQHRENLSILLHSLAHIASLPHKYRVVGVSLNANDYMPGSEFERLSYTIVKRLVTMLTEPEAGPALCWMRTGTFDRQLGSGVRTRIRPLSELMDLLLTRGLIWATHPYAAVYKSSEGLILLKDRQTGERTALKRDLWQNEQILPLVNARLRKTKLVLQLPNYATYQAQWNFVDGYYEIGHGDQLHRQFVDDTHSGGRLFGHWVQTLPKDLRQYLTINGEQVWEYDYQGMHVALAYDCVDEQQPDGDPYIIPGYGPAYRKEVKALWTSEMGMNEEHKELAVISHAVKKQTGRWLPSGEAAALADAFWSHHPALKQLIGTEAWKKNQFAESEIMLEVLRRLEERNIVGIPLHDAVIVPISKEQELKWAMRGAWPSERVPSIEQASWTKEAYPPSACKV